MGLDRWALVTTKAFGRNRRCDVNAMTIFTRRFAPGFFAAFAGVAAVLPAIILGVPNNNDLANHYHLAIPFYEALRQGAIYPSWLASPNFGYGDVVVRFYPPALYYLLAVSRT